MLCSRCPSPFQRELVVVQVKKEFEWTDMRLVVTLECGAGHRQVEQMDSKGLCDQLCHENELMMKEARR